jgi:hypothetical protein
MQISEHIENLLMNTLVLEKKNFKKTKIWKDTFLCLFTWKWAKQILG